MVRRQQYLNAGLVVPALLLEKHPHHTSPHFHTHHEMFWKRWDLHPAMAIPCMGLSRMAATALEGSEVGQAQVYSLKSQVVLLVDRWTKYPGLLSPLPHRPSPPAPPASAKIQMRRGRWEGTGTPNNHLSPTLPSWGCQPRTKGRKGTAQLCVTLDKLLNCSVSIGTSIQSRSLQAVVTPGHWPVKESTMYG